VTNAIAGSITAAANVDDVKTMMCLCVNCAKLDFEFCLNWQLRFCNLVN